MVRPVFLAVRSGAKAPHVRASIARSRPGPLTSDSAPTWSPRLQAAVVVGQRDQPRAIVLHMATHRHSTPYLFRVSFHAEAASGLALFQSSNSAPRRIQSLISLPSTRFIGSRGVLSLDRKPTGLDGDSV